MAKRGIKFHLSFNRYFSKMTTYDRRQVYEANGRIKFCRWKGINCSIHRSNAYAGIEIGDRFVDEGIDMTNFTYARFERENLSQLGSLSFRFGIGIDCRYRKIIEKLASKLVPLGHSNSDKSTQTLKMYNEAVIAHRRENPKVRFDPSIKDDLFF